MSRVLVIFDVFDNEALVVRETRTFMALWQGPAAVVPATYRVKIGIFVPGWGPLLHWSMR